MASVNPRKTVAKPATPISAAPEPQVEPQVGNGESTGTEKRFDWAATVFEEFAKQGDEARKAFDAADLAEENTGFESTLAAVEKFTPLTAKLLADWNPNSENEAEKSLREMHLKMRPDSAPSTRDRYSRILQLVVSALPADKAAEARLGSNNTDANKPQYKMVPVRKVSDGAKPGHYDLTEGDPIDVLKSLQQQTAAAGFAGVAALYQQGLDAYDAAKDGDFTPLRLFGKKHNKLQVRGRRWRSSLYLSIIAERLREYADSNPITSVGRVWQAACDAAQKAHRDYWKEKGESVSPDAEDIFNKIDGDLELLLDKVGTIQPVLPADANKTEKELLSAAVTKAVLACRDLDTLTKGGLESRIVFELAQQGINVVAGKGGKPVIAGPAPAPTEQPAPAAPVKSTGRAAKPPVAPLPGGNVNKPGRRSVAVEPSADDMAAELERMQQEAGGAAA